MSIWQDHNDIMFSKTGFFKFECKTNDQICLSWVYYTDLIINYNFLLVLQSCSKFLISIGTQQAAREM